MGILRGLFDLADDIVSIPTDMLGITDHYEKKKVEQFAKQAFIAGEITAKQYQEIISRLNNL